MLHRIKWQEHNSKRDGKSGLTFESCASCYIFFAYVKDTELFIVVSHIDPDGDDDTKRNNKCYLIWEVSVNTSCFLLQARAIRINFDYLPFL